MKKALFCDHFRAAPVYSIHGPIDLSSPIHLDASVRLRPPFSCKSDGVACRKMPPGLF
jgi:hypothetical protein